MPVDEDINLDAPDGITQDEIDLMNKQADEIEDIAKRTENNISKFEKAKLAFNTMTSEQLEAVNYVTDNNPNMSEVERMDLQELKKYVLQILEEQSITDKEMDEMEEKYEVITKDMGDLKNKINEVGGDFKNNFNQYAGIFNSPSKVLPNMMKGVLGKLAIGGGTIGVAFALFEVMKSVAEMMYESIISEIRKWYEAGGIFDTRKIILDEMKQVANFEHMMAVSRGDVFFTSDSAEFIRQGISQNDSNARTRIYGHKQYIQEFDR